MVFYPKVSWSPFGLRTSLDKFSFRELSEKRSRIGNPVRLCADPVETNPR